MSRTRTVLLVALVAGCGKPDAPPPVVKSAPPATPASSPAPASPTPAAMPPVTGVAGIGAGDPTPMTRVLEPAERAKAVAAAQQFLTGVAAGNPDLAAVAPEFKRVLAGGDAATADWTAEQYLKGLAGKVSAAGATVAELPAGLLATAPGTPTAGRAVVKLAKAGDRWQVGWVHAGPAGAPELAGPPTELGPKVAAAAFVESALGNLPRLAEASLTPAARGRIAPPLGNDPLGFSRGILSQKLKAFAGSATGYTLTVTGGTAAGELTGPGEQKRPFKLTLATGPDGWRVDDFEPR